MFDHKAATDRIFDRVHRTGEEIKNDLPNWIEKFIAAEGWKQVIDPATGEPFSDVGKWLVASWPLGPGMGQGRYSIGYDEFIALCGDRPKLKDMLVRHRPTGKHGGDRTQVTDQQKLKPPGGNSLAYIEQRLQRDHREHWEAYLRGEYKSARQAGIAAGFIKGPKSKLEALQKSWEATSKTDRMKLVKALTTKERAELKKWCE